MTPADHAEKMALYLVKLRPYLSEGQKRSADELVRAYRSDQRQEMEQAASGKQGAMFEDTQRATVPLGKQETSIRAAGRIAPHAISIRERVYQAIVNRPDTAEGLGIRLGMAGNTVRPRIVELCNAKPPRVMDSGRCRKVASGNTAIVWEAVR